MAKKEENKKVNAKNNKKEKNTKKQTKKNNESFIKGIKKELTLVKWPTVKEIVKYTIATIIFCIVLILFFELLTFIIASIKELFN